jgi:hypothetical protein
MTTSLLFDSRFAARFYLSVNRLPGAPMDITNRDRFIIGKALLYAIKYVDNLPEHLREQSERNDMVRLLKMLSPKTVERAKDSEAAYRDSVLKTGKPVDIGIPKHHAIPDDLRKRAYTSSGLAPRGSEAA